MFRDGKKRPFNFTINAAEFFAVVNSLHQKQRSSFLVAFSIDLVTLNPTTEYGKKVIAETIEKIRKQSEYGKMGGRPKERHPKGTLKGNLRHPKGTPKPELELKEVYKEIIDDLNAKGGFRYQVCDSVISIINGRISEGFTKEDFFLVHSNMIGHWGGDPKMNQYLRPATLYLASKFQGYLNQKPKAQTKRIMNADGEWIEVPV